MSASGQRLSWYRWEWEDSVDKGRWTACTVGLYKPTYDRPYVSVLISIANGGGRVLMRCKSLMEACGRIVIPREGVERLRIAETQAHTILEGIESDLRLLANSRGLAEGGHVVRTDTGEIIAEAERIVRLKQNQG